MQRSRWSAATALLITALRAWRSRVLNGLVQVRGAAQRRLAAWISAGSLGTFWCMPRLPVGTWAILSSASRPRTTLPNTA